MKISLIWGMDRNHLIGQGDGLPWRLPADMQWFRQKTMGKPILMGRKTYETIGKPLAGRLNLILSRQKGLKIEGCTVVNSVAAAQEAAKGYDELMVMGGAELYQLLLPVADTLYITRIDAEFEGDTWFPKLDIAGWNPLFLESHTPDEKNHYAYAFEIWQRSGLNA